MNKFATVYKYAMGKAATEPSLFDRYITLPLVKSHDSAYGDGYMAGMTPNKAMVGVPALAGAVIGGVRGAKKKEGDTPAKRLARILAYAAVGGAAGYGIGAVGDMVYKAYRGTGTPAMDAYNKAKAEAEAEAEERAFFS